MLINIYAHRHASRGMSLVELLVVMAIFSIVMMAVVSLFIPAVKSTSVQTQVTDVQSNLRLAMNRMTQDLLTAGFLIGSAKPIINESEHDFTIQTVIVGSGFGRVQSVSGAVLTLSQPDMIAAFPDGSSVRLLNPVSGKELDAGNVYTVSNRNLGAGTFELSAVPSGGVPDETVVVRIKPGTTDLVQTIRYTILDSDGDGTNDTLVRIVNDETQFLARNLTEANFYYNSATIGHINKVDISLKGSTRADVVGSAKERDLRTSVTLRNVY